jgi:Type II secretory pathway, component PulF
MRGRYGQNDTLNRFLNNLALLLIVISFFIRTGWLLLIAVILIGISYWRLFSKKIYQQVAINRGFQRFWSPIVRPFSRLKIPGQAALAIPLFPLFTVSPTDSDSASSWSRSDNLPPMWTPIRS